LRRRLTKAGVQSPAICSNEFFQGKKKGEVDGMNAKGKFLVGILTALAMMLLTFALPRGGAMRDAMVVQFPMTVGIWAIFVLLFVKLK
jgi:hypothetical protein